MLDMKVTGLTLRDVSITYTTTVGNVDACKILIITPEKETTKIKISIIELGFHQNETGNTKEKDTNPVIGKVKVVNVTMATY